MPRYSLADLDAAIAFGEAQRAAAEADAAATEQQYYDALATGSASDIANAGYANRRAAMSIQKHDAAVAAIRADYEAALARAQADGGYRDEWGNWIATR